MTARVWHSGPPPHVGWWNASNCWALDAWRWWDGTAWSYPSYSDHEGFALAALRVDPDQGSIEWTTYWPEHARVPRINPDDQILRDIEAMPRINKRPGPPAVVSTVLNMIGGE